jgi:hypothetical protein
VLADGRVFVAGGEYNGTSADADLLAAQTYDPVADLWTPQPVPPGWKVIGDAPSCVLADGTVLLGNINTNDVSRFDPRTNTWSAAGRKGDPSSEETFTLLPDGSVLSVQCQNFQNAEKYLPPPKDRWVAAGSTPTALPQPCKDQVAEIGPAILLPNGRVFAIGATGDTAVYTPPSNPEDPGSWASGPSFQDSAGNRLYPMDAPACLLPAGQVLCAASPGPPCNYSGLTAFFEYDYRAGTMVSVNPPPNPPLGVFNSRLLLLPTGQVLHSKGSSEVDVYTPSGSPDDAWRPTIQGVVKTPGANGTTLVVSGTQFNGLSQAVSYGDDAQMATNYPIARIALPNGQVRYLRTFGHSTMRVVTGGNVVSTNVFVPPDVVGVGSAQLYIVANGIPSRAFTITL